MATASTLKTIIERMIRDLDLGIILQNGYITLAAGSLTTTQLRNPGWDSQRFANWSIYRLGATAAGDYRRFVSTYTPSTGALVPDTNWATDTTLGSEVPLLMNYGLDPLAEMLDAVNQALEYIPFPTYVACSLLSGNDGDMAASTDTEWTDVGSPSTSAKSTTARRTPYGPRSYQLINNGVANEGTRSALVGVRQSRRVRGFAIASANVGTASLQIRDVTNSASLGTAVTHSEEAPQLMDTDWQSASTMKEVALYMLGTTTTSDIFWNQAWLYADEVRRLPLPAYVSEHFKAPSLFRSIPIGPETSGCWDADALDFVELKEGIDYRLQFNQPDANPNAVQMLRDDCYEYPLFVQANIPYAEKGTLSAEADTTTAPLHQLLPLAESFLLKKTLIPRFPADKKWRELLAESEKEAAKANIARPVKKIARPEYWGGVARM